MGTFAGLLKRREEYNRVVQLRYELRDLYNEFRNATEGLSPGAEDYREKQSAYDNERDLAGAEIDQIQTKHAFQRALYWGIPIPQLPKEHKLENDFWEWNQVHGRFYLTTGAKASIRRQAYQEMEMMMKPWISWGAIAISVVSLIVAVFKP